MTNLDATGQTLAYSTYLGDINGDNIPEYGVGNGIAVDSAGNAYITGKGYRNYYNDDAFVIKISPDSTDLPLTVAKAGLGRGTVTSAPAGINCGNNCTANFSSGRVVILTATPAAGSNFVNWSGPCSRFTVAGGCEVEMIQARTVTANFDGPSYGLYVYKEGTGEGTVTSSPAGINCGDDCTETYPIDTAVALTATPASGSVFVRWSGACTGRDECQITPEVIQNHGYPVAIFNTLGQPNDAFADAAVLVGGNAAANGSNQNATKEDGEPAHAGDDGGHSVWWQWTAPANGYGVEIGDRPRFLLVFHFRSPENVVCPLFPFPISHAHD